MTQRRRLSRAQVAATPLARGATGHQRGDVVAGRPRAVAAGVAPGVGLTPMDRQALLMGTFPDQPRAEIPNPRVLREMLRAEYEGSWPRPRDIDGLPRDVIAFRGKLYDRAAVDRAMAQDRAEREARMFPPTPWQSAPDAWVRRAEAERRAVERTGRVLVTWLIGRWRDQVSGK